MHGRALRVFAGLLSAGALVGAPSTTFAKPALVCPKHAVLVPAGPAVVGTRSDQDFDPDERPVRTFRLGAYCIDRTEVTVKDYAACVSANACVARLPAFAGADLPMTEVDWWDARAACAFRKGRLPTEVEWEHAARGNDDRLYPWGSFFPDCPYANFWGDLWGTCHGYGPDVVGNAPKGASPFGALDMAGNVLEWVEDGYDPLAWVHLPDQDPVNTDPLAPRRVVRGGSWNYDAAHSMRVSDRDAYPPGARDHALGFRCVYPPTAP